ACSSRYRIYAASRGRRSSSTVLWRGSRWKRRRSTRRRRICSSSARCGRWAMRAGKATTLGRCCATTADTAVSRRDERSRPSDEEPREREPGRVFLRLKEILGPVRLPALPGVVLYQKRRNVGLLIHEYDRLLVSTRGLPA